MQISVVIPTRNRRDSLLRLLHSIQKSEYPLKEVVIVDSSEECITTEDLSSFKWHVRILSSAPAVCIQRNIGIEAAQGEWVLLCDDDVELPADYLKKLVAHSFCYPTAGAITGSILQPDLDTRWVDAYPVQSTFDLLYRCIFGLSIWGPIQVKENILTRAVIERYKRKGNNLSRAGWPLVTDMDGTFFRTPFFGLGVCLIKKSWLINSPYDEVLDPNGYGDNFGVAAGFPEEGIHVLRTTSVYHYREHINRPDQASQFYRRILALHYFIVTKLEQRVSKIAFFWSLIGLLAAFVFKLRLQMIYACGKLFWIICVVTNPYLKGKRRHQKAVTPIL